MIEGIKQRDKESLRYKLHLFIRNKLASVGLVILIFIFGLVIFGPYLSPYDPLAIDFSVKLNPPSPEHFLGTDNYGRDLMSRIFSGARYTLLAAFISVLIGLILGTPLGVISGYFGKTTDLVLMRIMDILLAFSSLDSCHGHCLGVGAISSQCLDRHRNILYPPLCEIDP